MKTETTMTQLSREETAYDEFYKANADKIGARTKLIAFAYIQGLIDSWNQVPQGQSAELELPFFGKNDDPSPDASPLEHAAYVCAASVVQQWCGKQGMEAVVMTSRDPQYKHEYGIRELTLHVHFTK
jgi:hypothetical protein